MQVGKSPTQYHYLNPRKAANHIDDVLHLKQIFDTRTPARLKSSVYGIPCSSEWEPIAAAYQVHLWMKSAVCTKIRGLLSELLEALGNQCGQ